MPTRKADFQALAEMRIREAKILLDAVEWDGAYYLGGYSVECALKACIIKRLNTSDLWPEKSFTDKCYRHDLAMLLGLADLDAEMDAAGAVVPRWRAVKAWNEQSRYERGKLEADVRLFYEAITDAVEGVLPWIKARWWKIKRTLAAISSLYSERMHLT